MNKYKLTQIDWLATMGMFDTYFSIKHKHPDKHSDDCNIEAWVAWARAAELIRE